MDSVILQNIATVWLVAGGLLILLEVLAMPGIGFLYAGLAAVTVGGLLSIDALDAANTIQQFSWFFGTTAVWAAILWVPMKKYRYRTSDKAYQNIVGDTATVTERDLVKNKTGKVQWSGTIMNAVIAGDCAVESIPVGTIVSVAAMEGNKLVVKPLN